MDGAIGVQTCRRLTVLLMLCLVAFATPGLGQDPTSDWLGRLGLDRLRLQSMLQRLDDRSVSDEERARTADQLLEIYARLLSAEVDDAFRGELDALSERILDEVGSERGDPIRLEIAGAEWKGLLNRLHSEIILGHLVDAEEDELLGRVHALSRRTAQLNKRVKASLAGARNQLKNAQGSQIARLTQKCTELDDLLRSIRSLNGWVHAYLGWLASEPIYSNTAQRMFALLLSSDESSFVLPRDEDISVQRRREDWYSESIIGMAIARSTDASSATVEAWLDLLSVPEVSDAVRSAAPFYRLALMLRSDDEDRYAKARRLHERLDSEVTSDFLVLGAMHALEEASNDPEATRLARRLLGALAERGAIQRLRELSRDFRLESLPGDPALFHFMRGSSQAIVIDQLIEQGDRTAAAQVARLALADLDLAIQAAADSDTQPLRKHMLVLRGETHLLLDHPLLASQDLASAAELAQGVESGDLLWRAISVLTPGRPGVPDDPLFGQRRYQLIERLLENHPVHPRSQAARLIQLEQEQLMRQSTLEDAERLLQPGADPVVEGLAIRKAASILYAKWVEAVPADRPELARRFISVVQQPAILPADGAFDVKDLGLLKGLLRLSLQSDPPDLPIAERVLSAFDQAEAEGRLDPSDHRLEIESLRIEALLNRPFPDFEQLTDRLEALRGSGADPNVRRAALLLVREGRRSLDQQDPGIWGDSQERAAESVRIGLSMILPDPLTAAELSDASTWQLVRTLAGVEEDVYTATGDERALAESFDLYRRLVETRPLQKKAIAGLARTASALGRSDLARDSWQTLMNSATPGSPEFFEAKFHFLESLLDSDPERTRSILDQHAVLYPEYGTEPWGARLDALHQEVGRSEGARP
ncbi:MAG: hypothetical protein VX641_06520 [Planctomycetota bacterium]|nr:hypothetical protein [Planctomycetota bacterium]